MRVPSRSGFIGVHDLGHDGVEREAHMHMHMHSGIVQIVDVG